VELRRGDHVIVATAKVEIRRLGPFAVSKTALALDCSAGRRQTVGVYKTLREGGGVLLLPLKIPGFGGELVPRTFR